ncbi:ribonuclease H-like domain-containing protein [Tanacetum coccineum]
MSEVLMPRGSTCQEKSSGKIDGLVMPHELDFIIVAAIPHCLSIVSVLRRYMLFERAHMITCNHSRTPVDTESKLGSEVHQIFLYMHDPREPHLAALKRILRYVQGTLDLGLHLYASSTTSMVGYTGADWAGCPSTRSAEAEYRVVANVVAETAWLHNLLRELHSSLSTATLGLPSALFEEFQSSLSVQPSPAPTAGAY